MPSFFLRQLPDGRFEMVDGQQRARSLLAFYSGQIETYEGKFFTDLQREQSDRASRFLNYELNITIITRIDEGESIEAFYKLINSTGLRLNRPEIRKAEFYHTRLLRLVTTIASLSDFKALGLFTRLSGERMNDIDFASELVAQMEFGITDKKDRVDALYEADISEGRSEELRQEFLRILKLVRSCEEFVPLSKTRYRQKNDFYTLFGFLYRHKEVTEKEWAVFFRLLVKIGPFIRPSQEDCLPLMDYAMNCVTQSNSKSAREARLNFFETLLLNRAQKANPLQEALLKFFRLNQTHLKTVSEFTVIDPSVVRDPEQVEMDFEGD